MRVRYVENHETFAHIPTVAALADAVLVLSATRCRADDACDPTVAGKSTTSGIFHRLQRSLTSAAGVTP
jgi:hypothetical protein